ncbi:MAG: hypothetical protein H7Y41_05800 [Hyphomonadaceae bacterium]|nr:hypothetical protein [Clostridia bacterium]
MKVMIAGREGKTYVGINESGEFIKFQTSQVLEIGQAHIIQAQSSHRQWFTTIGAAAVFFLMAGIGSYFYPMQSVYVDINPSVELVLNYYDQVIGIHGKNEDGNNLIKNANVKKNASLEQGLHAIIGEAVQEGYFNENQEGVILLSFTGNETKLEQKAQTVLDSTDIYNAAPVVLMNRLNKSNVSQGKEQNMSAGKLKLIQEVAAMRPELKQEDMKGMTVRDILKSGKLRKADWQSLKVALEPNQTATIPDNQPALSKILENETSEKTTENAPKANNSKKVRTPLEIRREEKSNTQNAQATPPEVVSQVPPTQTPIIEVDGMKLDLPQVQAGIKKVMSDQKFSDFKKTLSEKEKSVIIRLEKARAMSLNAEERNLVKQIFVKWQRYKQNSSTLLPQPTNRPTVRTPLQMRLQQSVASFSPKAQ